MLRLRHHIAGSRSTDPSVTESSASTEHKGINDASASEDAKSDNMTCEVADKSPRPPRFRVDDTEDGSSQIGNEDRERAFLRDCSGLFKVSWLR